MDLRVQGQPGLQRSRCGGDTHLYPQQTSQVQGFGQSYSRTRPCLSSTVVISTSYKLYFQFLLVLQVEELTSSLRDADFITTVLQVSNGSKDGD